MLQIILNGNKYEVLENSTISDLIKTLSMPTAGTAIAVNGTIISHEHQEKHLIESGDKIDIIRPIGGG